jgi:spectinomycin phosphotransferase
MLEPPADLATDFLRDCLRMDYGLEITEIEFLPLGRDSAAWVYRADTADAAYFVKLRREIVNNAALVIPRYLSEHGQKNVVAPIGTLDGRMWTSAGRYAVVVYPFVSTQTGMRHGMTERQWREYGRALRQVHEAVVPERIRQLLRVDSFMPDVAESVRFVDALVDQNAQDDGPKTTSAEFWRAKRDRIRVVLARAEELGGRMAAANLSVVLCHADIHTNNVLVAGNDQIWIVDWDETMLAPRERDLMFVVGGIGPGFVSDAQEKLFFEGYGKVEIDSVALAYYRFAWAVSDIGAYGEQVFARPDLSATDRQEAADRLQSLFAPASIVDIALASRVPD